MDMNLAAKYASIIATKRRLEEELRTAKDEIASLEESVRNMMQENSLDRLPVRVGSEKITLYLHRQLWAKPKGGDRESLVAVLKRCGLSDLVQEQYNSSSLSAYVRERLANGHKLQPTLGEALFLDEVISVRGRRSPAASQSKTAKAMKTVRR
jgi:hypothetical protein